MVMGMLVMFGWKVDDKVRVYQLFGLKDKYFVGFNFFFFISLGIGFEVFWEGFFELQCDFMAYYVYIVDGVDQGFGIFCQDVVIFIFKYQCFFQISNISLVEFLFVDGVFLWVEF